MGRESSQPTTGPEAQAPIFRERTSIVCVRDNRLLFVRYKEPETGKSFTGPPGGGVEPGEDPARTGERETLEETGYVVRVRPETEFISEYIFNWIGRDYLCRTHWFAADLADPAAEPAPVDDADYNHGTVWLPRTEIEAELAYHPVIRDDVLKVLANSF